MRRAAQLVVLGGTCLALIAGCGSPGTELGVDGSAASATSKTPSQADLAAVQRLLYPVSPAGAGDCLSSATGPPSVLACPVTQRLASTLSAALASSRVAADPLCDCQTVDTHQVVTYSPGAPPGKGTIHVSAFGSPDVAYVVVSSTGQFLVDDIIYCRPSPHSIYGAAARSC